MINHMADDLKILARNIKRLRRLKGMTQQDVSYAMGSAQSTISELENMKNPNPSFEVIQDCAEALGTTVSELFLDTESGDQLEEFSGLSDLISRQDRLLPPSEPRISEREIQMMKAIPHPFLSAELYRQILCAIRDAARAGRMESRIRIELESEDKEPDELST